MDICPEYFIPFRIADVTDIIMSSLHCRIVDKDADFAEFLDGFFYQRCAVF
jgi:hypothetical protein